MTTTTQKITRVFHKNEPYNYEQPLLPTRQMTYLSLLLLTEKVNKLPDELSRKIYKMAEEDTYQLVYPTQEEQNYEYMHEFEKEYDDNSYCDLEDEYEYY